MFRRCPREFHRLSLPNYQISLKIQGAIQRSKITINKLDLYLSERVKTLTGNRQTPSTAKPVTIVDYPIAVVK